MTAPHLLLLATLAGPLLLLGAWSVPSIRPRVPGLLWLAPLPSLLAAMLAAGTAPLVLDPSRFRFTLMLDEPSALLLSACALLWSAAGFYARHWLGEDAGAQRFAGWWLITQAGSLGVFLSGDLISFYLLFAAVSLPAYGLIAHDGTEKARDAAATTLLLAVLGEVALLLGFVLLADAVPGQSLAIADAVDALRQGRAPDVALALVIAGFGLKAGLVPLHVWLPLAHPAAPMPASAVLSGAIVKAGIIGLLRFLPVDLNEVAWGQALVVIGFVTAFWGVVCGVVQKNPKTVLAYSTISQMGLAVAAFGMGVATGQAAAAMAVAFTAGCHVLAKGALFLGVGVASSCTGRRRLLLVLLPALVLALGFGGAPLTGGSLAKAATKDLFGYGPAAVLAFFSAAGSIALMLHFVARLNAVEAYKPALAPPLLLIWLGMAAASIALPWLFYAPSGLGDPAATLSVAEIVKAVRPMLFGLAFLAALRFWANRLPAIPEGDLLHPVVRLITFKRGFGPPIEAAEAVLRTWPAAGLALLLIGTGFAIALWTGAR